MTSLRIAGVFGIRYAIQLSGPIFIAFVVWRSRGYALTLDPIVALRAEESREALMLDRAATCCPECGAALPPHREACQTLFDEVLAREFGDYRYARLHRLTVDVYALQHPAKYMRSAKSYAAHLTGIYATLEIGAAAETNRAVQQWLNGTKVFARPGVPAARQRGVLTIVHVHEAAEPEDHLRRVHDWALSAWDAWRAYHHFARQWVEAATRPSDRNGRRVVRSSTARG